MSVMDDGEMRREARARRQKFRTALVAVLIGGLMTGVGFAVGAQRSDSDATGWGVLAGVGVGLCLGGAILAWLLRPDATGRCAEATQSKRDRLQAQRARQLWLFPLVTIAFLVQSTLAMQDILAGQGSFGDYVNAPLPVLYAWLIALITLGWDHQSRTHRKLMEDELTGVLRARAIGAAFVVLMVGVTVAFGLGLWRPSVGIMAVPFALAAAGATAGIRFAWLDREFGKDG